MNVLYLFPHPRPTGQLGGAVTRATRILESIGGRNVHIDVVETGPPLAIGIPGNCHRYVVGDCSYGAGVRRFVVALLRFVFASRLVAREERPDIIVCPFESALAIFPAYLLSKVYRVPWTVVLNSIPGYWYPGAEIPPATPINLLRFLLTHRYFEHPVLAAVSRYLIYKIMQSTWVISISRILTAAIRKLNPSQGIITIWPGNGILASRESIEVQEKEFDCVYAAAILPEKGVLDLLEAWARVRQRIPRAKLVVLGKGSKEMVAAVMSIIDRLSISGNVVIPYDLHVGAPTQHDVLAVLSRSRLLAHPSRIDIWPLVVGEALGLGVPVVAYDIESTRDAYGACRAVAFVPVGDSVKLGEAIVSALTQKGRLSEMREEARSFARKMSWPTVAAEEYKAYCNIITSSKNLRNHNLPTI